MKGLIELKEFGFEKVGIWKLVNGKKSPIQFEIIKKYSDFEDLIYAFVQDETVIYIGITKNTLKQRMTGYKQNPENEKSKSSKVEASTNKKLHKHILNLLQTNKSVDVYGFFNKDLGKYMGLEISPTSGLEYSLIKYFADSGELYNDRGIKGLRNQSKKTKESVNNFTQNLTPEYFVKGIFNLPVRVHKFIPEASCDVTIVFSNTGKEICARYTKSGKTHKISSKEHLSDWYSKYVAKSKKVHIQIINSTKYCISISG